jgi:hypothetical protein
MAAFGQANRKALQPQQRRLPVTKMLENFALDIAWFFSAATESQWTLDALRLPFSFENW